MRRTPALLCTFTVASLMASAALAAALVDRAHLEMGVTLAAQQGKVIVVEAIREASVFRAGVREGDQILQVDGVNTEDASTDQVLARMMAPRGDAIRLLLRRARGGTQEILVPRPAVEMDVRRSPRAAVAAISPTVVVPVAVGETVDVRRSWPPIPAPHSTGRPEVLRATGIRVGDPYVDFTLPRLGGGTLTLGDLVGRPIFIDFWATWCAPCRMETPALALIHDIFGDDIQMIGVTLDRRAAEPLRYAAEHGLDFPQLAGSLRDPALQAYGVHHTGVPLSILIDARGIIVGIDLHGEPLAQAMDALIRR